MSLRRKIPLKTRLFINPSVYVVDISALGLSHANGGRVLETKDSGPRATERILYKHLVDPGDSVVIPHHVSTKDVHAVAPQLREWDKAKCKPSSIGWRLLPLDPIEEFLFIGFDQEASPLLEYTYREAKNLGTGFRR